MSAPFVLAPGEQHPDAPTRTGPFIRFASGQTDGLTALAEVHLQPLTPGPNLHVHTREDELFYVLDGVMTVQVADELHEVAAGGLAWGPRGVAHAYANRGRDPLHLLIMWLPGGAEGLFVEMSDHLRSTQGAADPQIVADIQARHGARPAGPQISIPDSEARKGARLQGRVTVL